jgi:hypothetical protein
VTTLGELPVEDQRRLVYAPLWVYEAVATAGDPAGTAEFRILVERLEAAAGGPEPSLAGHVFTALREDLDLFWSAFRGDRRGPERGLREVASLLKRLPPSEAQAIRLALVELGGSVADASRWVGDAAVSEPERRAIQEVASWLGVPGSDAPA